MKINTVHLAQDWIRRFVKEGDLCIDATAGRGNDTAFLCEVVGEQGKVIAFDIQEDAVNSTKALLEEKGYQAEVHLASHTEMENYAAVESVAGIMFNFGYLPGGDHSICTRKEGSIKAIESGLKLLKLKGVMALCIYHGGDTGFEEKDAIMEYLKTIDSKKYTVIVSDFYNRPNCPPLFVGIMRDKL
ncbi:MAG: methyltransferase domain-containing protein [Cellulosilyticum sp.]|nr:methyltransferase domain-containing protein [Cellulosilyticum sp.]